MHISHASLLVDLCKTHGVTALYAFGSRCAELVWWSKNETYQLAAGPSDVDIAVGFGPSLMLPVPLRDQVRAAHALEGLLDVARVDLVTLHNADPFLAVDIVRGERLFQNSVRAADEFELFVLRRAADLTPFARQRQAMVLGIDP